MNTLTISEISRIQAVLMQSNENMAKLADNIPNAAEILLKDVERQIKIIDKLDRMAKDVMIDINS